MWIQYYMLYAVLESTTSIYVCKYISACVCGGGIHACVHALCVP